MEENDYRDAVGRLTRQRDKYISNCAIMEKLISSIENEIMEKKEKDERLVYDAKLDSDMESLYEERRAFFYSYLAKTEETTALLRNEKNKTINQYNEQIDELNRKIDDRDKDNR